MRSLFFLAVLIGMLDTSLQAGVAIVPGDEQYYSSGDEKVRVIYTEQNRYAAEQAMALEPVINAEYERLFGFKMDATLFVGLISQQNQVANGFSTQYPLNMQINYMGGSASNDYFTTTSWLNTLLYHETAHNYQINPKASAITRGLHSVIGNSFFLFGLFPVTSIPNVTISSQLLEGNAVLNESWHGNGGRLYSGRFKAETLLQAKAGHINPQYLYNQTVHAFPYYDRHYIIGGFFQLYLAEKYGLKKVNTFFYNHSKSWLWPFRTNHIFEMTFGSSYEENLAGFEQWLLAEGAEFVEAEGEEIATSQRFTPLNSNCDKIYFLTSNGYRAPELERLFKKDKHFERERKSYFQSRVINVDDRYYTQASGFNGPTRIEMGLFDEAGHIKAGSEGKVIQGYLSGGVPVYFDIPSSFDQAQLYVGSSFYAQVNSSVYIDSEDNLYYFKQKGKRRTLYKNREALYSFEGYYGIPSDVDSEGRVYFIANTRLGSSLFRVKAGHVEQVVQADNVIDARLVDDEEVLVSTVQKENYSYLLVPLQPKPKAPYDVKLFFETAPYYKEANTEASKASLRPEKLTLDDAYYGPLETHYAATVASVGLSSKNNSLIFTYGLNAQFIDPLLTNRYSLFSSRGFDEVGIVGAGYENNAHLLSFGGSVYGVYSKGDSASYHLYSASDNSYSDVAYSLGDKSRDYGLNAFASVPVIKSGYNSGDLLLNYYQDYEDYARSPLSLQAGIAHRERFMQAMEYNYVQSFSLFGAYDRSDLSYGLDYKLAHDLPGQFYLSMALKGVRSDFDREAQAISSENFTRGVRFSNFSNNLFNDPATVVMPTLEYTRFVKQAAYGEVALKKQFNARLLFFTFPFSLTRELLYAKHRYYDIQDFGQLDFSKEVRGGHTVYNESTLGATFEILIMNRLAVPLSLEYIHNSNTQEKDNFRFLVGGFSF